MIKNLSRLFCHLYACWADQLSICPGNHWHQVRKRWEIQNVTISIRTEGENKSWAEDPCFGGNCLILKRFLVTSCCMSGTGSEGKSLYRNTNCNERNIKPDGYQLFPILSKTKFCFRITLIKPRSVVGFVTRFEFLQSFPSNILFPSHMFCWKSRLRTACPWSLTRRHISYEERILKRIDTPFGLI